MRWEDTVAAECRWASLVETFLGDGEVILDNCFADYQGDAQVIVAFDDGKIAFYSWSYGSCSGCDSWEGIDERVILKEIEDNIMWFDSPAQFIEWLDGPVQFRSRTYDDDDKSFKKKIHEEFDKYLTKTFGPAVN